MLLTIHRSQWIISCSYPEYYLQFSCCCVLSSIYHKKILGISLYIQMRQKKEMFSCHKSDKERERWFVPSPKYRFGTAEHVLCWQIDLVIYKSAAVINGVAVVIASGAVALKASFETTLNVLMKLQDWVMWYSCCCGVCFMLNWGICFCIESLATKGLLLISGFCA